LTIPLPPLRPEIKLHERAVKRGINHETPVELAQFAAYALGRPAIANLSDYFEAAYWYRHIPEEEWLNSDIDPPALNEVYRSLGIHYLPDYWPVPDNNHQLLPVDFGVERESGFVLDRSEGNLARLRLEEQYYGLPKSFHQITKSIHPDASKPLPGPGGAEGGTFWSDEIAAVVRYLRTKVNAQ